MNRNKGRGKGKEGLASPPAEPEATVSISRHFVTKKKELVLRIDREKEILVIPSFYSVIHPLSSYNCHVGADLSQSELSEVDELNEPETRNKGGIAI